MLLLFLSCQRFENTSERKSSLTEIHNWFSIDLHVHSSIGSNDTDGLGTPENILDVVELAGLDFIWLTDHSNSLGSMHCEDVEDCPNEGPEWIEGDWPENILMGVEISPRKESSLESNGHVSCLPRQPSTFQNVIFTDRPFGSVDGANILEQCKNANGFRILNHPFGPTPWVSFDWTSYDFEAVEIYNGSGGFDNSDYKALEFWEQSIIEYAQNQKKLYLPIGSSDSHRWFTSPPGSVLDPAVGWPRTWVGNRHTGNQDIQQSMILPLLEEGHILLGDPSTSLSFFIENKTHKITAYSGDEISKHTDNELVIRVDSVDEVDVEVRLLELGNQAFSTIFSQSVTERETEYRIPLDVSGYLYVRTLPEQIELGARGFAMGNVITIE